ncbi:unnamed protein product [Miscanthus lutarioriparius]|uniref:Uncharacterized protein n=1 Tax=Miscanthus lutarioriparius TaxID=422564 RepID=A0A811QGI9_9POAL|nr:unnamed protein product [Miscanthus lutarioriparius]
MARQGVAGGSVAARAWSAGGAAWRGAARQGCDHQGLARRGVAVGGHSLLVAEARAGAPPSGRRAVAPPSRRKAGTPPPSGRRASVANVHIGAATGAQPAWPSGRMWGHQRDGSVIQRARPARLQGRTRSWPPWHVRAQPPWHDRCSRQGTCRAVGATITGERAALGGRPCMDASLGRRDRRDRG